MYMRVSLYTGVCVCVGMYTGMCTCLCRCVYRLQVYAHGMYMCVCICVHVCVVVGADVSPCVHVQVHVGQRSASNTYIPQKPFTLCFEAASLRGPEGH